MAIEFECPTCGTTLSVSDDSAGRAVRCGHCMAVVEAPAGAEAVPEAGSVRPPVEPVAPPPRPRRRPRKARRTSTRSWLLGSLFASALVFLLCCGGVYLGGQPKWRTHDSAAGGFRVELPAAPRADLPHWAGVKNDPNVKIEGTILLFRLEEYAVVYGDVGQRGWGGKKDDALIDEAVKGMLEGQPGLRVVSQTPVTVSGYPAREVVFETLDGGTGVARIVIAETRFYIVVAGGRFTRSDSPDVRRFLDSFEVTDPQLRARRKEREEADRRVGEVMRRLEERQEQMREERKAEGQKRDADKPADPPPK